MCSVECYVTSPGVTASKKKTKSQRKDAKLQRKAKTGNRSENINENLEKRSGKNSQFPIRNIAMFLHSLSLVRKLVFFGSQKWYFLDSTINSTKKFSRIDNVFY